jgi:hypothetical protein
VQNLAKSFPMDDERRACRDFGIDRKSSQSTPSLCLSNLIIQHY